MLKKEVKLKQDEIESVEQENENKYETFNDEFTQKISQINSQTEEIESLKKEIKDQGAKTGMVHYQIMG